MCQSAGTASRPCVRVSVGLRPRPGWVLTVLGDSHAGAVVGLVLVTCLLSIFSRAIPHLCLHGEVAAHTFTCFYWFVYITELWEIFTYSEYKPFIRHVSQIFSPSVWLAFALYNTLLWRAKVLHFGQVQVISFEMVWAFVFYGRSLGCLMFKELLVCFLLDVLWFELIRLFCDPFWVNFCVFCKVRVAVHPFCMWMSSCSRTVCWKYCFSLLSYLGIFMKTSGCHMSGPASGLCVPLCRDVVLLQYHPSWFEKLRYEIW